MALIEKSAVKKNAISYSMVRKYVLHEWLMLLKVFSISWLQLTTHFEHDKKFERTSAGTTWPSSVKPSPFS